MEKCFFKKSFYSYSLSGLFVNLYSAVERLLAYHQDGASTAAAASTPTSAAAAEAAAAAAASAASVRCILFHELCPALHAIMADGLKPEVK